VATPIIETGLRVGEAVGLLWTNVHLIPAVHAKLGYVAIREGKSDNAKRNLSLSETAAVILRARKKAPTSRWVFPGEVDDAHIVGTSLDHMHAGVRKALKLPAEFVLHSLRHTMLSRLGEAGADPYSIMKIAGHGSLEISRRYVHPTPEGLESAFERLRQLNSAKFELAEAETAGRGGIEAVPTNSPTGQKRRKAKMA
ncbi:MAG: site-specific recombinase XerD, partial [Bryobacterales bacterium]|nr:site-specific recombinase XerD [Bryobacterales bacterium]